jgi:hypothetical protein
MSAKGAASRICAGDTAMDVALPVLAYGEIWRGIHLPVGADEADVLQRDAARGFAGTGGAEGGLRSKQRRNRHQ